MTAAWSRPGGVFALPGGALVRGRRVADLDVDDPADLTLLLADGPVPPWPHRRIRWPDFGVPWNRADALAAFRAAHDLAYAGGRVEACCRGGRGRTGTALAALAVLDGLTGPEAVEWVRREYDRHAVETPWQAAWLSKVR